MNKEILEVLGYHSEYERNLARLYKLFTKKFPDDGLWPYMVEEETKHECWIKQIIPKVIDGVVDINVKDHTGKFVHDHMEMLSSKIESLKFVELTPLEALRICVEYEEFMLDKDFFGNLVSEAPAVQNVLDKLVEDTLRHRIAIKERIESLE